MNDDLEYAKQMLGHAKGTTNRAEKKAALAEAKAALARVEAARQRSGRELVFAVTGPDGRELDDATSLGVVRAAERALSARQPSREDVQARLQRKLRAEALTGRRERAGAGGPNAAGRPGWHQFVTDPRTGDMVRVR